MEDIKIPSLIASLSNELPEDRYIHTLGVAYTSASLAMRYGADINKALTAGCLHDIAKRTKTDTHRELCERYHIELTVSECECPQLIHSKLGAYIAEHEYGINDPEILSAITYHTTGRPNMTLLEKIVYIADYIEPGRYKQKRLPLIRKTAFTDIDRALLMILGDTLEHLSSNGYTIDDLTKKTYEYYRKIING